MGVSCGFDVQLISCAFGQPRVCVRVHTHAQGLESMLSSVGKRRERSCIHSFAPRQEVRLSDCCIFLQ